MWTTAGRSVRATRAQSGAKAPKSEMGSARRSVQSSRVRAGSEDATLSASSVTVSTPASTRNTAISRATSVPAGARLLLGLRLDLADAGLLLQPPALGLADLVVLLHGRLLGVGLDLAHAGIPLIPAPLDLAVLERLVAHGLVLHLRQRRRATHRRQEYRRHHRDRQLVEHAPASSLGLPCRA